LFPLDSVVFYTDGNSLGNTMEDSGKQTPKMGFKSPSEQRRKFSKPLRIFFLSEQQLTHPLGKLPKGPPV
jgi:hypothetical protein